MLKWPPGGSARPTTGVFDVGVLPRPRLLLLRNTEPLAEPSAKKFLALPESSCEIALICRNNCRTFCENVVVAPFAAWLFTPFQIALILEPSASASTTPLSVVIVLSMIASARWAPVLLLLIEIAVLKLFV